MIDLHLFEVSFCVFFYWLAQMTCRFYVTA